MVESQQYHVDKLDLERKTAYVRKVEVDYYTDAMTYTNVRVIDAFAKKPGREIIVEHGEVQVVSKVVGYKKIKFYTSENLGYGDVNLPEKDMHTTSYWFTIPRDRLAGLSYNQAEIIDGLAGLAYSLHHLAAMMLMADLHDIDRAHRGQERRVVRPEGPELADDHDLARSGGEFGPRRRTPSTRRSSCSTPIPGGSASRISSSSAMTPCWPRPGSSSAAAPAPAAARPASARRWRSARGRRRRPWRSWGCSENREIGGKGIELNKRMGVARSVRGQPPFV